MPSSDQIENCRVLCDILYICRTDTGWGGEGQVTRTRTEDSWGDEWSDDDSSARYNRDSDPQGEKTGSGSDHNLALDLSPAIMLENKCLLNYLQHLGFDLAGEKIGSGFDHLFIFGSFSNIIIEDKCLLNQFQWIVGI